MRHEPARRRASWLPLAALLLLVPAPGRGQGGTAGGEAGAPGAEDAAGEAAPGAGEEGEGDAAGAPPREWHGFPFGNVPPELARRAVELRNAPLGERVAGLSELLLDTPYEEGCEGEGVEPDPDPPARYDVFDCVTFVEEVLALALAAEPGSASVYRRALRYRGEPSYAHRRHFFAAQWIPDAIENGLLRDVTAELGEPVLVEKTVTPGTWRGWRRRALFALPDELLPTGTYRLPVLPLDRAREAVVRVPQGAVVVTVRQPREGVPIVVMHLGFAVRKEGTTYLRHATHMKPMRVYDHRLAWYVDHVSGYTHWPVLGLSFLLPREQGPRLALLAAGGGVEERAPPSYALGGGRQR